MHECVLLHAAFVLTVPRLLQHPHTHSQGLVTTVAVAFATCAGWSTRSVTGAGSVTAGSYRGRVAAARGLPDVEDAGLARLCC